MIASFQLPIFRIWKKQIGVNQMVKHRGGSEIGNRQLEIENYL